MIVLLSTAAATFAQEIKPRGYFSKDSLQIGEHLDFTVIVEYPRGMELLFPDSSFDYRPFEFLQKSYSSTVSDNFISNDSVVYTLTSFELDSIQSLSLPVFVITAGDSTRIESNSDQVYLQQVITESIDSLSVQETVDYQQVSKAFNYPYLLIALGVLVVLAGLVAIFFGKEIKRRYKLHLMRKGHLKFLEKFKLLQEQGLESSDQAEALLGYWKWYLERLEGMPYTKLTTREIVTFDHNEELNETLKSLDSNIYGEFKKGDIGHLAIRLKEFGIDRFAKKIEEVKHA